MFKMSWLRNLVISLVLCKGLVSAQAAGWQANQVNATMCQWQEPRVAVIRDTVYIDGGYLWWQPGMADGTYGAATQDGNPLGIVYLLNFSIPFNTTANISQILSTISKAPNGGAANNFGPLYYDGALLANDDEFYTYGGLVSKTDAFSAPDSQFVLGYEAFWYGAAGKQFSPGFIQGTLPQGVTRYVTSGGAVSVPSENKGFYFSGLRSASNGPIFYTSSNESLNADVVSNTLVSLDMSTQRSEKWSNQTLPATVPGRANPEIVWVPVSQQGVLIAIGGAVNPQYAQASQALNATQMAQDQAVDPGLMETVSVYDVANGTWYNQPTTGEAPGGLTQGCSVLASAQDGSSHNIYWYGGFDGINPLKPYSDDVYVLSLPSFVWTKVYTGTSTHGRAGHKCVKPYPDQMFVVGGYPPYNTGSSLSCVEGGIIQVFNLSSATWLNTYDPAVWSNYTVPGAVSTKIGGNGAGGATLHPSSWANQSLESVFNGAYDMSKIKSWYPYASRTSNATNPRQTAPVISSVSSGLPSWVAPVLGVVLGLVAISAILVCILLWRRRKYLRRQSESMTGTSDMNRYRIMSWVRGADTKAPTVTSDETPSSPSEDTGSPISFVLPAEAAGTQVHEMPDTSQPQELSDTGMRYIPTAAAGLYPGLKSHGSHASHVSSGSNYSDFSDASLDSKGLVSPIALRGDSPNFGTESRSKFVSGISATSSDYRGLASTSDEKLQAEESKAPPKEGATQSVARDSIASPVSPSTPPDKEGKDYLSSQSPAGPSSHRKSNFGEMLDE